MLVGSHGYQWVDFLCGHDMNAEKAVYTFTVVALMAAFGVTALYFMLELVNRRDRPEQESVDTLILCPEGYTAYRDSSCFRIVEEPTQKLRTGPEGVPGGRRGLVRRTRRHR